MRLHLAAFILILTSALAAAVAFGAGDGTGPVAGHGWVVLDTGPAPEKKGTGLGLALSAPEPRYVLIHLAPREGEHRVPRGSVRIAGWLDEPPIATASWGRRVYVITEPPVDARIPPVLAVSTIEAARGTGSTWYNTPEGRYESLPPLTGEITVKGLVGTLAGPAALVIGSGEDPGLRLLIDGGDRWEEVPLPWHESAAFPELPPEPPGPRDAAVLLPSLQGVGLLVVPADRSEPRDLWTAQLRPSTPSGDSPAGPLVAWTKQQINLPLEPSQLHDCRFLVVDDTPVMARWTDAGDVSLSLLRPAGPVQRAVVKGVPRSASIVALPSTDSVAILWCQERPEGDPHRGARFEIREVSLASGRLLFEGPAVQATVLSKRELGLLAVMMVGVTAAVIVSLLRPRGVLSPSLPARCAVAPPMRRLVATAIDVSLAAIIAGRIHDVNVLEIIGPSAILSPIDDIWPLLTTLGIAGALGTIGEWAVGGSIGKLATGCRVANLRPPTTPATHALPASGRPPSGLFRPTIWQAAVRNFVKWSAPPLCVFALSDPMGRHIADLAAGTSVVVNGSVDREARSE
ncbi:MAG: RDD family protein [Phycisphaeraceae bacterium]|nr:RDD family protein [Phycisphaeraceae bacterium]